MSSNRRRGFTLVEMIVAAVLLVVGVAASLACISGATRTTRVAAEYSQAAFLAQQRLAEINTDAAQQGQITAGEQQGNFDQYPGFSWDENLETTDFSNVFKLTLTITWPGTGTQQRSAQFVTYLQQPNASTTPGQTNTATGTGG